MESFSGRKRNSEEIGASPKKQKNDPIGFPALGRDVMRMIVEYLLMEKHGKYALIPLISKEFKTCYEVLKGPRMRLFFLQEKAIYQAYMACFAILHDRGFFYSFLRRAGFLPPFPEEPYLTLQTRYSEEGNFLLYDQNSQLRMHDGKEYMIYAKEFLSGEGANFLCKGHFETLIKTPNSHIVWSFFGASAEAIKGHLRRDVSFFQAKSVEAWYVGIAGNKALLTQLFGILEEFNRLLKIF